MPARVDTTGNLQADLGFMAEARDLAVRIPGRPWPNPPVGAVIVKDSQIIGRGMHHGAGTAHAERVALAETGASARGATLYCTLEPCNHHGRTGPCTEAILEAGIGRVVYAVADPNPQAAGGAARLREAGVEVVGGVLTEPCLDLIWPFICTDQFTRPYVELKTATSLDGRFAGPADPAGRPGYLTSEAARRDVHARRRWVDLVLVGSGTARHDHPRLDVRLADQPGDGPNAAPAAGVVAADGGRDAPLNRDRWLVFHADRNAGALPADAEGIPVAVDGRGRLDCVDLLQACGARGLQAVMLEGGPNLASSFLAAGLVDRWVQYVAPALVGDGPTWPTWTSNDGASFSLTRADRIGPDVRLIWDRRDFAATLDLLTPGEAC